MTVTEKDVAHATAFLGDPWQMPLAWMIERLAAEFAAARETGAAEERARISDEVERRVVHMGSLICDTSAADCLARLDELRLLAVAIGGQL